MLLRLCAALYVAVIVVEWIRFRRYLRFILELLPLVSVMVVNAFLSVETARYVAFGDETAPITVVVIMLGSVLLGTTARHLFYLGENFRGWGL